MLNSLAATGGKTSRPEYVAADPLLSREEVARELGVAAITVDRYRRNGIIPAPIEARRPPALASQRDRGREGRRRRLIFQQEIPTMTTTTQAHVAPVTTYDFVDALKAARGTEDLSPRQRHALENPPASFRVTRPTRLLTDILPRGGASTFSLTRISCSRIIARAACISRPLSRGFATRSPCRSNASKGLGARSRRFAAFRTNSPRCST